MDLFEHQVEVAVQSRVRDILGGKDPELLLTVVQSLSAELASNKLELEAAQAKVDKWERFLDSDGYLDVAEVADQIQVSYIPPSGKPTYMGRNHFIQMLVIDQVIVSSSNGKHIHSKFKEALTGLAKVFSKPIGMDGRIRTSVKFNARGLDWLDSRCSNDNRVWRSNSKGELFYE